MSKEPQEQNDLLHERQNSVKNRSVLIIQKEFKDASDLVEALLHSGFNGKNIYVSTGIKLLSRYFQNQNLNYIFIEHNLYCKEVFELAENIGHTGKINIFLTNLEKNPDFYDNDTIISKTFNTTVKAVTRPITPSYTRSLITQAEEIIFYRSGEKYKILEKLTRFSA